MRVLFVCLGNICRSPSAEGVMRALVREAGLEGEIELDSAGTGAWHVGSAPDPRAVAAAAAGGSAGGAAPRQVTRADLENFDFVLAMDSSNLRELRQLGRGVNGGAEVRLLREFDPASAGSRDLDVPDPYYGAAGGFDEGLDLVQAACRGLLVELRAGGRP